MYSIGEFSKISGVTIKALRLYHEKKLLIPRIVDDNTSYRYYDQWNLEKARGITYLKKMMFQLEDIKEILDNFDDESDIIDFLSERRTEIHTKIKELEKAVGSIDEIIKREKEVITMLTKNEFEIEEKSLETILVASIRWKGKYEECGKRFSKIFKKMGRFACGKPINLYYDEGYKEEDADIETCVPVRKGKEADDIAIKQLEGGKALALIHKGPYDQIGRSYEKIVNYANEKGLKYAAPTREVYLKGPGMIFKGNPKNYLTEIQLPLI